MSERSTLLSLASSIIVDPAQYYIQSAIGYLFSLCSTQLTIVIHEFREITRNEVYEAAEIYLGTKISPDTKRFTVHKTTRERKLNSSIEKNQEIADTYQNIKLKWRFACVESQNPMNKADKKFFELTFHKKFKEKVLNEYLPHVLEEYQRIKDNDKVMKLYAMNLSDNSPTRTTWGSINFEHPSTFETLAMDKEIRKALIDDLKRFVGGKDIYKGVGKAWKRGYLLYGPPGTGKSSLVAAMANYLKYDIYDLELASVYTNSELRKILASTTNRSIIVIEDIDCSVDLNDRQLGNRNFPFFDNYNPNDKLTLSGILNFIDGLWSSCGDERIIIFTTNHIDRLDPALLRSGRMDMHIPMSYCTPEGFRFLASKYLNNCNQHRLFGEIEGLIKNVEATPGEMAGELIKNNNPDKALDEVVNFLKRKQSKTHDTKNAKRIKTEKIASKITRNCRKRSAVS